MEKRLSYTEYSSQLSDKNIVVIEIGKHYTKCGFAGESAPRAIIKSSVHINNIHKAKQNEVYLHDIVDPKILHSALATHIEKIYFTHLAVSPRERKVILVESVFSKSIFRNTIARLFLDTFEAPSILFVPDHLMALATLGKSTGLVVDLGAEEAISIAVVEGVTLLDCTQFASLGSRVLDSLIYKELVKVNSNERDLLNEKCIEDIRIRTCFVAPFKRGVQIAEKKIAKSKAIQLEAIKACEGENKKVSIGTVKDSHFIDDEDEGSPAAVKYLLNNQKYVRVPGNIREGACEIFFEIYGHEHSLTTMIIETILSAPIDCRKSLSKNILLIGGLSNIPGLRHRLAEELLNINKYDRKISHEFKLHKTVCANNYVSWLGASMFCTASSTDLRSITREQWIKDGKRNPKDWSDLLR